MLAVGDDGIPHPVPGGTVASGGDQPVSIAVHGDLVYVANAGATGSNYTGFRLGWDGRLHAIPGSTVALPDALAARRCAVQLDRHPAGRARASNTSQIDSFIVDPFGRLHAAPGSPYSAQGLGPFGQRVPSDRPDELYVSNAHNGAGAGHVSAFHVGFDGALHSIGASPFADDQTAPCWVEISHDGRFLFAVNTAQPSISLVRDRPRRVADLARRTQFRATRRAWPRSTPVSAPTAAPCSSSTRAPTR